MQGFDTYLRQVKFSPDGKYFVVAATGRASSPTKLCDSAARFETAGTGRHNPTWVQRTGGDSLYAVAVTGAAVYVGGHQRYLDNPYGRTRTAPARARSPGPASARSTRRPARRCPGTRPAPAASASAPSSPRRSGLIVGSDTDQLGKEYHGRIGMFPLN